MITCKEDLINTYVKNTPELRREFLSLAVKFGLIDSNSNICESSEEAVVAYWHDVTGDNPKVGCWFAYADQIKEECRELTLSDLKPRTKVEYEKVTESIFDLKDEFERGELVSKVGDQISEIKTEKHLVTQYSFGYVHRKVERPVEWREDAVEFVRENAHNMNAIARNLTDDGMYVEAKMTRDQCYDFARILLEQEGE